MVNSKHRELRELTKEYLNIGVVYAFSDNNNVVYIGSTKSFYNRLISHNSLKDKHNLRYKSNKSIYDFNISVICTTEDLTLLKMLEQKAIDTYTSFTGDKPIYNIANCYDTNKIDYRYKNYL